MPLSFYGFLQPTICYSINKHNHFYFPLFLQTSLEKNAISIQVKMYFLKLKLYNYHWFILTCLYPLRKPQGHALKLWLCIAAADIQMYSVLALDIGVKKKIHCGTLAHGHFLCNTLCICIACTVKNNEQLTFQLVLAFTSIDLCTIQSVFLWLSGALGTFLFLVWLTQDLVEYYQQHSLKEGFSSLDTTLQHPYREQPNGNVPTAITKVGSGKSALQTFRFLS